MRRDRQRGPDGERARLHVGIFGRRGAGAARRPGCAGAVPGRGACVLACVGGWVGELCALMVVGLLSAICCNGSLPVGGRTRALMCGCLRGRWPQSPVGLPFPFFARLRCVGIGGRACSLWYIFVRRLWNCCCVRAGYKSCSSIWSVRQRTRCQTTRLSEAPPPPSPPRPTHGVPV